jgi:YVTN family beta-propeller protein
LFALAAGCANFGSDWGDRHLIVLNKSEATAWVIDIPGARGHFVVEVGVGPHEVASSPDGTFAAVANYGDREPGNTLTLIVNGMTAAAQPIDLGEHRRPHGIQFVDDRSVVVTSEDSRALLLVDVLEGKVTRVMPTEQELSHMVVLTPDRARAFVANIGSGSVTALDMQSGAILKQIVTGQGSEGIDITPDGREVWVANRAADTLCVIDARKLEVVATLPCAKFPIRIKTTPDGVLALVSCAESGDVAVFDIAKRAEVRRISMGIQASEKVSDRLINFGESPTPIGILIRPDGQRAYIANTNADIVTELDLSTWQIVARIPTGKQPDGLGWSGPRATKP